MKPSLSTAVMAEATTSKSERRAIYLLYSANTISLVGNQLTLLAIPWFVLETTGSATRTGLTAFFYILPVVIAGFFGGAIVDRLGYKRTSIVAENPLERASSLLQSDIFSNPLSLIPFAVFLLLFGPLPEEMTWRGYALDGLQSRWNALTASLMLGIAWTLWHMPLFLIEGSFQYGLGVGTPWFWLYMLDKVPQSILMTWIYSNNRRSTLSAVLSHFMVNFVGELFALSLRAKTIYIASWWIAALLVITIWKPQRFVRAKSAV